MPGLFPGAGSPESKQVVGPADDEYEREVDQVAEQPVSMSETPVQWACPSCEKDEPVQREPLAVRITPLHIPQARLAEA
ncbi:MAG TPA: hypothetical protein PKK11_09005 [Methanothrix sp.]|nr:hypothetical protein [Methanothrix sp.]